LLKEARGSGMTPASHMLDKLDPAERELFLRGLRSGDWLRETLVGNPRHADIRAAARRR
jgi:hypothetical protein